MFYWLSTTKMTVMVETDENDILIEAAPIVRRFLGQTIEDLAMWMNRQEGFKIEELN